MLVLSRKVNERLFVDDNIRITVVSIRGNQVRLGIEAPDRIKVFREELCVSASAASASETDDALKSAPAGGALAIADPQPGAV